MFHLHTLADMYDKIEKHIKEKLSINQLADIAYLSPSYLQLLIKKLTGQPLMDYVRGRKLAHCLNELYNTDMRIIDIAVEYGFSHEQSFGRAFRREFGCTPAAARRTKKILHIQERIAPKTLYKIGRGLMQGPQLVVVPGFQIIGVPTVFKNFDANTDGLEPNKAGNQTYYGTLLGIPGTNPEVYYAVCDRLDAETIVYTPGVELLPLSPVPKGFDHWVFPTRSCVRFVYVGQHPIEEISMIIAHETYQRIEEFFRAQDRYQLNTTHHYERIDKNDYDGVFCRFELYCPISDCIQDNQNIKIKF